MMQPLNYIISDLKKKKKNYDEYKNLLHGKKMSSITSTRVHTKTIKCLNSKQTTKQTSITISSSKNRK